MLSLHTTFSTVTLLYIITGVSCEELTPVKDEESSLEDSTVTLSYTYSKLTSGDYFFWYRQYPGKPPEFLISHSASGTVGNEQIPGLKIKVEQNQINMNIFSANMTDSAVYYCAVRPATGANQNKIFFGSGTRLTIEPKEKYEPSYYKVGTDSNAACLATGFSQYNAAISREDNLFNTTNAILISGDKLYNQVALLSGKEGKCELVEKTEEKCEDTIEPDPMVNLMALTIIGLRLLFLKTIVFNVLMTFRLWISQ